MKKNKMSSPRKLSLNKETLRLLRNEELPEAPGAGAPATPITQCAGICTLDICV